MPVDIAMPTAPALARLDRVELAHAGTWSIALGGTQTFTREDLAAAIAALDCPAVRRPVVKLGHFDGRTDGYTHLDNANRDGEPALGWVTNLSLTDDGRTLVGDLVGLPGWFGQIAASAYPDRSMEGSRRYTCAIGHRHQFVMSAVALLGVTPPGIGTLGSLQDHPSLTDYVRAMYEVAASTDIEPGGEPVAVIFHKEAPVPKPELVAAAVTVDELRTAFHSQSPFDYWITEIQLDPLQLIVTNDSDSKAYRIPVTVGTDGDSFTFGVPVEVEITYVDAVAEPLAAAAAPRPVAVKFASRAESRPGGKPHDNGGHLLSGTTVVRNTTGRPEPIAASDGPGEPSAPATPPGPPAPPTPAPGVPVTPAVPAAEPDPTTEPEGGSDMSLADIRSRLGLDETADEAAVLAALDDLKTRAETPPAPPTVAAPDPELVAASAKQEEKFAAALGQIDSLSTELAAIKAREAAGAKTAFFAAARQAGQISPADSPSWETRYDRDPELVREIIGAIKPGTAVPIAAAGYVGSPEQTLSEDDLLMLLPPEMRTDEPATTAKVSG